MSYHHQNLGTESPTFVQHKGEEFGGAGPDFVCQGQAWESQQGWEKQVSELV